MILGRIFGGRQERETEGSEVEEGSRWVGGDEEGGGGEGYQFVGFEGGGADEEVAVW